MTVMRSVVLGYGAYLPERILTNAELAKMVDTSDEWIVQRTGIKQRHIAADGEFTSHLGLKAAQAAIALDLLQRARRAHEILTDDRSTAAIVARVAAALDRRDDDAGTRLLTALEAVLRRT